MLIWQDALAEHAELLGQLWLQWQEGILRQIWEQRQNQVRQQVIKFPGGEPLVKLGDLIWQQVRRASIATIRSKSMATSG